MERPLRHFLRFWLCCALLVPVPPAHAAGQMPFAPMLATRYEPGIAVPQYWVSEKLDGVRGRWDGRALWTRAGHPVDAPPWFVEGWPAVPMDGELWIGRGRFDEVSGIVRAGRGEEARWRQVRFMVFDLPAHEGPFEARLAALRSLVDEAGVAWLRPVAQERLPDEAALQARLATVAAAGGEGLMLHHRDAPYRPGRSGYLLKLKPHEDAEARVVGHLPGKGKYAGMLGALLVEHADGVRFRLGTGFTDAQRADPPPLGAWVTYRYDGFTSKGLPRFARFLRVRDEADLGGDP